MTRRLFEMQVAELVVLIVLAPLGLGCEKSVALPQARESSEKGPASIYVVNFPLEDFAAKMAPAGAGVVFPTPEGIDPAFWKPPAETVEEYQRASLILLNGAGYARWTGFATLPRSRTVITSEGCRERFLEREDSVRHRHGPDSQHVHTGLALNTWLDLRLAACQASRIRDALLARFPEDIGSISARFGTLERDLLALDERLREVGLALDGRTLLASHPVYAYLADAYGLVIAPLHLEPEHPLNREDWITLDEMLARHPSKWMLWEGVPSEATIDGLADRGVIPVLFTPAARRPPEGDFIAAMKANTERLECATGVRACR